MYFLRYDTGKMFASFALVLFGCSVSIMACTSDSESESSSAESNVQCDMVGVDRATYCVYGRPITETGYSCPDEMSNSFPLAGGTVCSDNKQIPDGHKKKLEKEVKRKRAMTVDGGIDTGTIRKPDGGADTGSAKGEDAKTGRDTVGIDGADTADATTAQCSSGEFVYRDRICGPRRPDAGGGTCKQVGDGKCYEKCNSDKECQDPNRPHCSVLGLFAGGDYNCNQTVKICRSNATDDCPSN